MKLLADKYHVLAPDLPGFGFTTCPVGFEYTFDNLAEIAASWVESTGLDSFAIYVFDYGAPVGWRIALRHPAKVKAVISQNGNAYKEGFGEDFWKPIFDLWKSNNGAAERSIIRHKVLTLETTKFQYVCGVPATDVSSIDPQTWTFDYLNNLSGERNEQQQLDLFFDYRSNLDLYPRVHEWFRKSQVPLLAVWGRGDPAFIPAGAEAFKKDLPSAVITFVESGHFALETKGPEIAQILDDFLSALHVW
ncbi:hypothetical protein KC331_g324 [Hortaea werneckii]|nr:hypothetical protein KC331_g324 [Hortaea werneckii]KAI7722083.1 hypothetical protein KC353_g810 [Hortaea werneckii]